MINFIKKHKILVLLSTVSTITIVLILIFNTNKDKTDNLVQTPQLINKNQATYQSITPGRTTKEELNKDLGEPIKTTEENGKLAYEYTSSNKYRFDEYVIENNIIVFAKEIVNNEDNKTSGEIIKIYGLAPYKLYDKSKPNSPFHLSVYPENGLAYLGHDDGGLTEIWYFMPTSIDEFKNKWAPTYQETQPEPLGR